MEINNVKSTSASQQMIIDGLVEEIEMQKHIIDVQSAKIRDLESKMSGIDVQSMY